MTGGWVGGLGRGLVRWHVQSPFKTTSLTQGPARRFTIFSRWMATRKLKAASPEGQRKKEVISPSRSIRWETRTWSGWHQPSQKVSSHRHWLQLLPHCFSKGKLQQPILRQFCKVPNFGPCCTSVQVSTYSFFWSLAPTRANPVLRYGLFWSATKPGHRPENFGRSALLVVLTFCHVLCSCAPWPKPLSKPGSKRNRVNTGNSKISTRTDVENSWQKNDAPPNLAQWCDTLVEHSCSPLVQAPVTEVTLCFSR